jgi:plastocyanin
VRGGISRGRRIALGALLALAGSLVLATTAFAGIANIFAADDAPEGNRFEGEPFGITEGTLATFINTGDNTHTVTADADGPDGKPLFRTGNVSEGDGAVPVNGTEYLAQGAYPFHCSIHSEMQATLNVGTGPGAPVARPSIAVKVKSKKLKRVVKSGKLRVEVSAAGPTAADGVSLSAKKGRKGIAKRASTDVNPGGTQTVKLTLKKKAAEKLAELDKAKVRVTAEVDFGSPAKASKKLK